MAATCLGFEEVRKPVLTMQDLFITQLPTPKLSSDRLWKALQEGGFVEILR